MNRLGFKAASVTALALVAVFGLYWGGRTLFFSPGQTPELARQDGPGPTPLLDDDGDGLPNAYEDMYRTDPARTDTDTDGVSDRDELTRGTDPTIPAPNDAVKPITGGQALQSGGQVAGIQTYTQQYLATLPADVPREEILNQTRLEAFIATHRGELLPTLPEGAVLRNSETGKDAISAYLDMISSFQNKQLHQVTNEDIEAAFSSQLQLNSLPMDTIVAHLDQNNKVLKTIPAPAEVADMHEKLLRSTTALHRNVMALRDINQDFVGGLVAVKNIDELGPLFTEIATSITELEAKYGLE